MDDLPYEFIDRVFTKLDTNDIQRFPIQSPLWSEACRVYRKKINIFSVVLVPLADGFHYAFLSSRGESTTLKQLIGLDNRFVRITTFCVGPATDMVLFPVDDLNKLFQFISHFNVEYLEVMRLPRNIGKRFAAKCVKNGLKTKYLCLHFSPEAENFLKSQLKSDQLTSLVLHDNWPLDMTSDIEAFVCRPNFSYLVCNFNCLGMNGLKRIVAYWKTTNANWNGVDIRLKTTRNLEDEFASWLAPNNSPDYQFQDTNEEFCLRVACCSENCILSFYK